MIDIACLKQGLIRCENEGVANWVNRNLTPGSGNYSEVYALIFDMRGKDCVRIAEDDHVEAFKQIRAAHQLNHKTGLGL